MAIAQQWITDKGLEYVATATLGVSGIGVAFMTYRYLHRKTLDRQSRALLLNADSCLKKEKPDLAGAIQKLAHYLKINPKHIEIQDNHDRLLALQTARNLREHKQWSTARLKCDEYLQRWKDDKNIIAETEYLFR